MDRGGLTMKKLCEIKTRKVIETYYEIEADSLEDAKETTFTRSNKVNSITFEPYVIHTRDFLGKIIMLVLKKHQ